MIRSEEKRHTLGAVHQQDIPDTQEEQTRDGKERPAGLFTIMPPRRGHTAEQASHNHANVEQDDDNTVKGRETAEEGEGDEEKGGGEEPVNVACVISAARPSRMVQRYNTV